MFRYFDKEKWGERMMESATLEYDLDLELCTEIHEVDEYFDDKGIPDIENRIAYLSDYMRLRGTDYFGEISPEKQFAVLKELFVSGKWKFINGR